MRRFGTIALSLLVWAAIIFYIVWSSDMAKRRRSGVVVERLEVTVADSGEIGLVSAEMVERWIAEGGLDPAGKLIGEVEAGRISQAVLSHGSARSARTYVDLEGIVHVTVRQRRPVVRVIASGGYDFYITDDRWVIPGAGYPPQYLPLVTGDFRMPFAKEFSGSLGEFAENGEKKSDKNYLFLCKLTNFVNYIGESEFWRSQIVQINVTEPAHKSGRGNVLHREPDVELIPRAGDHVVVLGQLDGYEEKLDRLMLFYRQAAPVEGWGRWSTISLEYDNQIVCK